MNINPNMKLVTRWVKIIITEILARQKTCRYKSGKRPLIKPISEASVLKNLFKQLTKVKGKTFRKVRDRIFMKFYEQDFVPKLIAKEFSNDYKHIPKEDKTQIGYLELLKLLQSKKVAEKIIESKNSPATVLYHTLKYKIKSVFNSKEWERFDSIEDVEKYINDSEEEEI